jgi:site-specific recombinase XerD
VLAVGANPKVAQEMLGHSNVTIILDTYSYLLLFLTAQKLL